MKVYEQVYEKKIHETYIVYLDEKSQKRLYGNCTHIRFVMTKDHIPYRIVTVPIPIAIRIASQKHVQKITNWLFPGCRNMEAKDHIMARLNFEQVRKIGIVELDKKKESA